MEFLNSRKNIFTLSLGVFLAFNISSVYAMIVEEKDDTIPSFYLSHPPTVVGHKSKIFTIEEQWGGNKIFRHYNIIHEDEEKNYNIYASQLDLERIGTIKFTANNSQVACIESKKDNVDINVSKNIYNLVLSSSNSFGLGSFQKNFNLKSPGNIKILHPLKGKKIKIEAKTIYLEDGVEAAKKLEMKFQNLDLVTPFCHPFKMSKEDLGYTSFLSFAHRPSLRISWENLKEKSFSLAHDFFYKIITEQKDILLNKNNEENIKYILSSLQNNTEKEQLAVKLVKKFYEGNNYKSYDTQMFSDNKKEKGNGFDGLFVKDTDIVLVEIKYNSEGNKKPGNLVIGGQKWRQLSTPYNKNRLKEMKLHYSNLEEAYKIIIENQKQVKLKFIVLNAKDLTIDFYNAGMFLESNLN